MAGGTMVVYKKKNGNGRKNRSMVVYKPRVNRGLPLTGFPKQKVARLRYVQDITITTPGAGLSKSLPFVANGCYDPYYPIGGHQPKGFDQWMSVYANYNVLGSKCKVRMVTTGDEGFCWGVGRTATPNELDSKSLNYILECRMNKGYSIAGGYARNNNTPSATTRTATYSQKKQHGSNSTGNTNLTGTNAGNPSELTIFEVWACPPSTVTTAKTASFVVTIDYIVLFTEQRVLTQS